MRKLIAIFIVSTTCLCIGCFNPDEFTEIDSKEIIRFISPDTTVVGDGVSTASIRIQLSDEAAENRREITLKTTLGSFAGGTGDSIKVTASPDSEGNIIAEASLAGMSVGEAVVTAKVSGVVSEENRKITFEKAFPSLISLQVDSFVIFNSFQSDVLIKATLRTSNGGKPSIGHQVIFSALDGTTPIGVFLNGVNTVTTDNNGTAQIRYSVGNTNFTGTLILQAMTELNDQGESASATTLIQVIDD